MQAFFEQRGFRKPPNDSAILLPILENGFELQGAETYLKAS